MAQGDKRPVIMEADIGQEGGVPPYLHASQHSASGTDPITPEMIGAMKLYLALAELGLDESTATAADIVGAMADGSELHHPCGASATSAALAFPSVYGLLRVVRRNASYAEFEYRNLSGRWYGYYNKGASANPWTGWRQIATTDYAVNKAGDTMTGTLALVEGSTIGGCTPLHTGNKPSGSYTGNGDATARTIETGGIGSVCVVWDQYFYSMTICTESGVIYKNHATNDFGHLTNAEAYFYRGVIRIATKEGCLNTNGTIYNYQVL